MKKPIIFAAPAALALLALAYFFVLPMLSAKPAAKPAADAQADSQSADSTATPRRAKRKAPDPGLIYPLKERVLNLSSSGGGQHYARIELAMEFARPDGAKPAKAAADAKGAKATEPPLDPTLAPVTDRLPQINDALVRIIGAKTAEEMTSAEGKDAFKKEFSEAIDAIVPKPDLQAVYIVQLLVQ